MTWVETGNQLCATHCIGRFGAYETYTTGAAAFLKTLSHAAWL